MYSQRVLILIVLEFALAPSILSEPKLDDTAVLILIVLEFALALLTAQDRADYKAGLNPYCTGICSRTRN